MLHLSLLQCLLFHYASWSMDQGLRTGLFRSATCSWLFRVVKQVSYRIELSWHGMITLAGLRQVCCVFDQLDWWTYRSDQMDAPAWHYSLSASVFFTYFDLGIYFLKDSDIHPYVLKPSGVANSDNRILYAPGLTSFDVEFNPSFVTMIQHHYRHSTSCCDK